MVTNGMSFVENLLYFGCLYFPLFCSYEPEQGKFLKEPKGLLKLRKIKLHYVNRIVYLKDHAKDVRLTNIFHPILRSFEHAVESMHETWKVYGGKIGVVSKLKKF